MTKHADAIWKLLWPYIANEDPPDSGDSEKDLLHLMESVLPNVWNEVRKLDAVIEPFTKEEIRHIIEVLFPVAYDSDFLCKKLLDLENYLAPKAAIDTDD